MTPTEEPKQLQAGDTWRWRREDLTDYPATDWTLRYRFASPRQSFEVTATADGLDYVAQVAAAVTADIDPDTYTWRAYVTDGTERYTVDEGQTRVIADLEAVPAGQGLDVRTHARKVLDAIEAVLEKRATKDQMSMSIHNRSLGRTPIADLLLLRDRYRAEVTRQEQADRAGGGRGRYYVRFG